MHIPFEQISSKSRVWIYQADRTLSVEEIDQINSKAVIFADNWEAHGKTLKASIQVFHNQFLVIAVDESYNMTTGCSIDSSVAFVRTIASKFGLDLFDRTKVAFLLENEVYLTSLKNVKSKIEEGTITDETFTFNNLLTDKEAFEKQWLTQVKDTWLSKYL
jgi:hypothetical protein